MNKNTKIALVAGAVALPVAFGIYKLKQGKSSVTTNNANTKAGGSAGSLDLTNIESWTSENVHLWLESIKVSEGTRAKFVENCVDGVVLVRLQESHLQEMGVTATGDRIKIAAALDKLVPGRAPANSPAKKRQPVDEDDDGGMDPSKLEEEYKGRLQAADQARKVAVVEEQKQVIQLAQAIISSLKNMFSVLGSEEFLAAPREEQKLILEQAEAQLEKIIPAAQQLPEREREQILPTTESLRSMIQNAREAVLSQPDGPADTTPAMSEEDSAKFAPIAASISESLRELRKLVHSKEAKATPAAERKMVLENVLNQIAKIQSFTVNFPAEAKQQLGIACQELAKEAVEELGSSAEADQAGGVTSPNKSHASAQHLTNRLRAIFASLRDPQVMRAPTKEQSIFFETTLRDVASLKAEAQRLEKAEERDVVLEIATNIEQALAQTKRLCDAKIAEENRSPILPLPELVGELRDLMGAVKSEDFLTLPPAKREELLIEMDVKIEALAPSLAALPDDEKQSLAPSFDKLKQFITALRAQNKEVMDKQAGKASQSSEEKDNAILASVIDALKEMYGLLSSENFRNQPAEARAQMSKGLLSRLDDVKSTVATLGDEQQEAVRELIGSLENMLQQLAALGEASAAQQTEEAAEEADLDEDEQSALSPKDRKAVEVVDKVQQLFAVINSEQFTQCTPERRRDLAEAILRQVNPLQRDVMTLGDEHRTQLTPVLASLKTTLTAFIGDSAEAEADVYSRASRATQKMQDGKVRNMAALKEMMDILEELDAVPPTTEEQLTIRKEFQMTLSATIDELQSSGATEAAAAEAAHQEMKDQAAAADNEEGDEEGGSAEKDEAQLKFRTALAAIQHSLENTKFTTVEELTPYTTILEEILNAAEKDGIDWRGNKRSLTLVKAVIDTIQEAQVALHSEGDGTEEGASSVVRTIIQAHDTLKASRNKMSSVHELTPYLELLDTLSQMQDGLGLPELKAQQQLQQLVIAISEDLKNDVPPALDGEEDEEADGGESKEDQPSDEQEATIVSMLRQLAAKIAVHECTKASDLGPYIQMVESFRAKPYKTPAVVRGIEQVDSIIKSKLAEIGKTPEDCKAELVESKRDSLNKLHSVITHDLFIRLPQEQQISAIGKASRLLESLTAEESAALEAESSKLMDALEQLHPENEEIVQGSVSAELSLIPRILDRLKVEDFLEQTTAFEVRQIASMFNRLTENRELAAEGDSASVLQVSKDLFNTRLGGFGDTPCKDPTAVQNPLQLRKMISETEDGIQVVRYLLISPEEEEYEADETIIQQFAATPKKAASPITKEISATFEDNSEALILILPGDDTQTDLSHLAELSALAEILTKTHRFNVNCLRGAKMSAKDFQETIEEIVKEKPTRFFLYIHSGANKQHLPHELTFPDGSSVTYTQLMKQCAGNIKHTWLAHDSGRAFDCAVMKDGHASPYAGVGITDGGFSISNISRCWLYDGLFTPMFLELVTAPGQLSLCPEDAVNHIIRGLTGTSKAGVKGCYLDDEAITASFLLDALDAEEEDPETVGGDADKKDDDDDENDDEPLL